jgi:hypothetical protein
MEMDKMDYRYELIEHFPASLAPELATLFDALQEAHLLNLIGSNDFGEFKVMVKNQGHELEVVLLFGDPTADEGNRGTEWHVTIPDEQNWILQERTASSVDLVEKQALVRRAAIKEDVLDHVQKRARTRCLACGHPFESHVPADPGDARCNPVCTGNAGCAFGATGDGEERMDDPCECNGFE